MIDDFFLDKRQVRRSFSRAAKTYDEVAVLQREINNRMLERLSYIKHAPKTILDAGSGTGISRCELQQRYPDVSLIELDIATEMLRLSRSAAQSSMHVCGDIENLPFSNACIDMVWSNLSLQWINDLAQAFAEARRVLSTGGLLMFSTFGVDTLKELRSCFSRLDPYTHVNRFSDMHDIGDLLLRAGFENPVVDMECITMVYPDVGGLLRDLKALGAHNLTHGRRQGLMGKSLLHALASRYEKFRQDGGLPATFEVIYGHAWKGRDSQRPSNEPQPIRMYPRSNG